MSQDPRVQRTHRRRGRRRRRRINKKRLAMLLAMLAVILLVIILLITGLVKLVRGFLHSEEPKPTAGAETAVENIISTEAVTEPVTEAVTEAATEAVTEPATEAAAAYVGTLPDIDINSWEFMLVNAEHPIGEYEPETVDYDRVKVDARILEPLTRFVEAAKAQGLPVYMSSAYRDYNFQATLYENKLAQGYSKAKAATIVAPPGTSEHQTGLAADITDVYRKIKDKSLEDTETYQWMSAHCHEYGFIVRFPNNKSDVTGIIYEPWHFRYVGVEAATFMMNNNLCLEEFIALYQ